MIARAGTVAVLAAGAITALAAWAWVGSLGAVRSAAAPAAPLPAQTMAPVMPDYLYRNGVVADLEGDVHRHADALNTRMLAGQYLQRFREMPDVGDLLRAVASANRALRLQPRDNVAAESTLASAYTALHKFRLAKRYADDVAALTPWNADAVATDASLAMELGEYREARKLLAASRPARENGGWEIVAARYAEITGDLPEARRLVAAAMLNADDNAYGSAENRAWYHWRAAELEFEAGDLNAARAQYARALAMYPRYWHAMNGLAKVAWARKRWGEARTWALRAADVYPLPDTLGYLYDAQIGSGDRAGAHMTLGLVKAIERIGNAQGINDRLIALFYADHAVMPDRAVAIARRDLATRDDVYAEDTLGWALAMDHRWNEALPHAERAALLGTPDARLLFHTAIVELHNGRKSKAQARLRLALALNPYFHPQQADFALRLLSR